MKWNGNNKKHYIEKDYKFTDYGESFDVEVSDLTRTSKFRIVVVCDLCETIEYEISYKAHTKPQSKTHICKDCNSTQSDIVVNCWACDVEFTSTLMALKKSKSGNLFCSNMCVGEYNSLIKDKREEKECTVCNEKYLVKQVHSDTTVACSIACHNEWQKAYWAIEENTAFKRKRITEAIQYNRTHGTKETKPEKITRKYFESLGYIKDTDFFQEKPLFDRYFADFYFPKYNLVVEVYGDYWHANPDVYGVEKKPLNEMQTEAIKRDRVRKNYFEKSGFNYVIIWEKDIYKDIEYIIKRNLLVLYPRNDYTQDTQTVKVGG